MRYGRTSWTRAPSSEASTIDVAGTEVTLTGKVHTSAERDAVKEAVWATPGVHAIEDRLAVL